MRIAFTARALFNALNYYGVKTFKLADKYGKFIVHMNSVVNDETLTKLSLTHTIPKSIKDYWFMFETESYKDHNRNELDYFTHLDKKYPDDLVIIVDNLREFAELNIIYGPDSLKSIDYIGELLK